MAVLLWASPIRADAPDPAGHWSDRFDHDSILGADIFNYMSLASSGEAIYSGPYRLQDERWILLGEPDVDQIVSTAAAGTDAYFFGYSNVGSGYFISHWDGTQWSTIAQGLSERVWSMVVHDGALYVGGWFTATESFPFSGVARWDGTSWTQLGQNPPLLVESLAFVGEALYAGGGYSTGVVWKWSGSAWSTVGLADARVQALHAQGNDLFAAGRFFQMRGTAQGSWTAARRIARWNGEHWSPLGAGLGNSVFSTTAGQYVQSMTTYEGDLIAGGYFFGPGAELTGGLARWDGEQWTGFGSGTGAGVQSVESMAVVGEDLYVAGFLEQIDEAVVGRAARWNGHSWSSIGDWGATLDDVQALCGNDHSLFAAGSFTTAGGTPAARVARWNGIAWSALGSGTDDRVDALALDGEDVIAGGRFLHAGGVDAANVARWNGQSWMPLGAGPGGPVTSLLVTEDGIYAGGESFVSLWDGENWTELAATNGSVRTMVIYDGALHVGGDFHIIGGTTAHLVAKLDGEDWVPLGQGFNRNVRQLLVRDEELWVVGSFYPSGDYEFGNAAIWDGAEWRSAGAPVYGNDLASIGGELFYAGDNFYRGEEGAWTLVDDLYAWRIAAVGDVVYLVGAFREAGGVPSRNIAALATGNCGNGVLDEGEQCDPAIEGTGTCCNMNDCTVATAGEVCRPLRGPCDVAEQCDGATTLCPEDANAPAGSVCEAAEDACSATRVCDGDGISCPHDAVPPCDDGDVCNGAETCEGDAVCGFGEPLDCDDAEECTIDSCDAVEGCAHDWAGGGQCAECGDADGDLEIDASDAVLTLRAAVGLDTCDLHLCDHDGNGKRTTADALRILQLSVGLDPAPQCPTRIL